MSQCSKLQRLAIYESYTILHLNSALFLLGCFLHRKTFHISLEHIFTNDIFGLLKGSRHDGFSGSSSWIYSLWNLLTI